MQPVITGHGDMSGGKLPAAEAGAAAALQGGPKGRT